MAVQYCRACGVDDVGLMTAESQERFSRGRRFAIRIAAVLGLVLFAFFFSVVAAEAMDIIQAGTEGSPNDPPPSPAAQLGAAHPGEAVHVSGALSTLAIGGSGLIALIIWPERSTFAYHVLAAMLGVVITLPLVGDPDNFGGQAGFIDPLFLVLVIPSLLASLMALPWGHWRSGTSKPTLLLLAAIVAAPAAWYGVDQALMQRNTFPPTADPHHNAHWWVMAVAAFMVVLVTAAAAFPSRGWRLGGFVAGAASIGVGGGSILDLSAASAVWIGWALAAVLWGVGTIWFTLQEATVWSPR